MSASHSSTDLADFVAEAPEKLDVGMAAGDWHTGVARQIGTDGRRRERIAAACTPAGFRVDDRIEPVQHRRHVWNLDGVKPRGVSPTG